MPELTTLQIQFRYRTEGIKKVQELRDAFRSIEEGTKKVDQTMAKTNAAIAKIRGGVESLLGTFAKPFTDWYNAANSIYNIYKGFIAFKYNIPYYS